MDLFSYWLGKKVAKGEGKDAVLTIAVIFVLFMSFIALMVVVPMFAILYLAFIILLFGISFLMKKKKKRK